MAMLDNPPTVALSRDDPQVDSKFKQLFSMPK